MNDGKNSDRKLKQWNNILEKSDCASKKTPTNKTPKKNRTGFDKVAMQIFSGKVIESK